MTILEKIAEKLREKGYPNLTAKSDCISGIVYGIDVSNAPKSVPKGENTGPFATLDNPNDLIPENIEEIAESHDLNVQVLGHGSNDIHIYIN